ncbi:MAG: polysaccharide biosynthesis/export family protein [Arenibacterium sp.]
MVKMLKIAGLLFVAQVMAVAAWAQDNYKIKPGDVVRIEVLEDSAINRESLVLPDGRVTVPLAGTVRVGGRSVDEVRADVASKLAGNFATEPTVFVSLVQLGEAIPPSGSGVSRRMSIYFLGEVNSPGVVEVRSGTTLLQAIAQAGGFSRFAAVKRVQLRRTDRSGKQQVFTFNYNDVLAGKTSIGSTRLASGDVIVVPPRKLFE